MTTTNNNCRLVCDPVPDPCNPPPPQEDDDENCEEEDEEETEVGSQSSGKRGKKRKGKKKKSKDEDDEEEEEEEGEEEEEEEEKPKRQRQKDRRRHHHRSHKHRHHQHRSRIEESAYASEKYAGFQSVPILQQPPQPDPGMVQCDCVAALILCVYAIAIAILTIGVTVYVQDSKWNRVVDGEKALPRLQGPESLFSGKHLYFSPLVSHLNHTKGHLHRGSRPFELTHLIFFGIFIFFTLFQCPFYITRGNSSQFKFLCCYYGVFGVLSLALAMLPLISWNDQVESSKLAGQTLQNVSQSSPAGPPSTASWLNMPTQATIADADVLMRVMMFCVEANSGGIEQKNPSANVSMVIYDTEYHLHHLETLGFCGNYRDRLIITVLGFLFAVFCLIIPCASSMESGSEARVMDGSVMEGQRMSDDTKMMTMEQPALPLSIHTKEGGQPLTPEEVKHLEYFARYVLQPPQENNNYRGSF